MTKSSLACVVCAAAVCVLAAGGLSAAERKKVFVESSIDGVRQPCYIILPEGFDAAGPPRPLLVSLHSWSADVEQRNTGLEEEAAQRGWIYLFPHFRGPNKRPEACGSPKAQQDILDAVAWTRQRHPVDKKRIYLAGGSGGGHMTMLMVGRHPNVWTAASAWVGISDLASWHARHAKDNYGEMLRSCCGGPPGSSREVDEQYQQRSPLTHLHRATETPLDIAAGVHDGHKGSVPIRHSLDAFNVIAKAVGAETVSEEEIAQISRPDGRLEAPRPCDLEKDPDLGRAIYLRRTASKSRVTIFEGGHEVVAGAAVAWLAGQAKPE